jgi:hypothetical protein
LADKNHLGIIQQHKGINLIILMLWLWLEVIGSVEDHLSVLGHN